MKKFRFSLQAVYQFQKTLEKQKKIELSEIQAELNRIFIEKADCEQRQDDSSRQYRKSVGTGMPASQMAWYGNFAEYLQDRIRQLNGIIEELEKKKQLLQSELIAVMKEIETLDKLREEQYRIYLDETAKEEEKELGDLMSYRKTAETAAASRQD